jgi:hypothetical protein
MARPKSWPDVMQAKFSEGTFARIAAVLGDNEDRTAFVREAVERELELFEKRLEDRINAVLKPHENRMSFVRAAVEHELERREIATGQSSGVKK